MKKNILLVEYATPTIEIIKELLSHPIFEITVVNEGDIAKDLLDKNKFDMLITAAMLPKFHGFNLSLHASSKYPDMRIIIISEIYKGMDYKHQAITRYKADEFFEKPFNEEKFRKRVLELLRIKESDLGEDDGVTTAQVPVPNTAKIPTLKKIEEEEEKLTSEDIFGDIIKKVEESPSYEIKLDEEKKEKPKPNAHENVVSPQLLKEVVVEKEEKKTSHDRNVPKDIDLNLEDLVKPVKSTIKEERKIKKIEDDISKKFEETLSGLGIKAQASSPIETKPIKVQEPARERIGEKKDEVGGYDILGLIARGGMAELYKVKKKGIKGFEKIIAIKKILSGYGLDEKYIEMFVDEAKIAAELSHPNIVQIYDLGKKDDYYFIAMEYVPGRDLRLILRKLMDLKKLMPEELSLYIVLKILEALNYAHQAKNVAGHNLDIVHRDVSPPNILVSYGGEVKLTDFGVSKASIKMHHTVAGALKGKILYMSPEQANAEKNIDYRSDLYSVGIILFELITGQKLFLEPSEMAILKKVQTGDIIKPSQLKKDIDSELENIIFKMLEKDIKKRYQNASDIIGDLQAYINKNYNHVPTPAHLSHAIFVLFEEEIKKEAIKIDLKPIPYEIKKIKKKRPFKKEEEEETVELTLEEEIKPEEEIEEESEEESFEDEDFQPAIEIGFDEDKEKEEVIEGVSEPHIAHPGLSKMEEEYQKKRKFLLISISIVIVLGALIILLLIINSSDQKIEPLTDQKPVVTESETRGKPEVEKPDAEAELLLPKVETEVTYSKETLYGGREDKTEEKEMVPEPGAGQEETPAGVPLEDQGEKTTDIKAEQTPTKTTPIEKQDKETEQVKPDEEQKQAEEMKKETLEEVKKKVVEQKIPEQEKIQIKEGQIVPISGVDSPPVPIFNPRLEISIRYTRTLRSNEKIFINYLIDHNGNVETVRIIRKSSSKKINSLIKKNISGWKFKPATKDNVRVKVWKTISLIIKK